MRLPSVKFLPKSTGLPLPSMQAKVFATYAGMKKYSAFITVSIIMAAEKSSAVYRYKVF
jgi:hypothetical protein